MVTKAQQLKSAPAAIDADHFVIALPADREPDPDKNETTVPEVYIQAWKPELSQITLFMMQAGGTVTEAAPAFIDFLRNVLEVEDFDYVAKRLGAHPKRFGVFALDIAELIQRVTESAGDLGLFPTEQPSDSASGPASTGSLLTAASRSRVQGLSRS